MNELQKKETYQVLDNLYANVSDILANARKRAYSAVNFAMVESYWLIGQQIVEYEQHGEARADYGKGLLKELAARLTVDFGKGFDESNLRYMRLFLQVFSKCTAEPTPLSHSLSPTMVAEYQLCLPDKALLQQKMQDAIEQDSTSNMDVRVP